VGALNACRTKGESMSMPKKPNTTDGMPATLRSWLDDLAQPARRNFGHKHRCEQPRGTASAAAPAVTRTIQYERHSPKKPSVGYQRAPNSTLALTSKKGALLQSQERENEQNERNRAQADVRMSVSATTSPTCVLRRLGLLS